MMSRRGVQPDDEGAGLSPTLGLPYRSRLQTSLADLTHQWNDPVFARETLAQVDGDLGLYGSRAVGRLYAKGAMRPSQLADILQTGASNVSKILKTLDSKGLIERQDDPLDSRATLVVLTPSGSELARRIFELADERFDHILADWTEEEIEIYTVLTRRIESVGRRLAEESRRARLASDD